MTVTVSPISKSTRISGRSSVASDDDAAGGGGLAGLLRGALRQQELHHVVERQRGRPRGGADEAGDARGVRTTPGVLVELHAHQDVARQHTRLTILRWPFLISTTSSIGTSTWKM
jgi:hypothetical protein